MALIQKTAKLNEELAKKVSEVQFPGWAKRLFTRNKYRYKVAHGGRGGTKSWSAARALILLACKGTERVLCTREFQTSIAESVHRLLSDQIVLMGLGRYFEIQQNGNGYCL